ncbi:MAG: acyl-CoA dehydrogenase family protein [Gammaproteobacteria bacterium]|nr:acyl-CoA dehydrogenase family protein [Gammaproteobacteria bacterium]
MPTNTSFNDTDADVLAMLHDRVVDYCTRALPRTRLRETRQRQPPFELVKWREMAKLGWLGLVVPEAEDGLGLGAAAVAAVCRELGRVVAGEPMAESAIACGALLGGCDAAGDELRALLSGATIFTCPLQIRAWREEVRLVARRDGTGYLLDGVLDDLPLAPDADRWLLPARLAGEVALFVVRAESAGLSSDPRPLADGSRDAQVSFSAVHCTAKDCLAEGHELERAVRRALALSGIAASAYLIGLCEALLDMTLDYLRTRRQFGRALGSFQALQHRLVDMYLHSRLSNAALATAVLACDGEGHADLALASARARYRACATATMVVREAIQLHGAIGYTEQCDVSLYVQRALVMTARYGGARAEINALPALALGQFGNDAQAAIPAALPNDYVPPLGDWNGVEDRVFRSTVRQWIEVNYPAELRHVPDQLRWTEIREWHRRLIARGWAAPAWPAEYGGMGLAPNKMLIFIEELERWGVARAPDQGIVMIGPILIEYGTAEQRARYLRAALTGEQIWCQGYSEPNAGSDLASLTTSAVLDGDEFVVNGQKTWTTHGLDATHMYCLVRTDPTVKPQAGISFLLIDLDQPGVTVRPIVNLGGHVDFCEVFLDNVRVPRANLVGPLNQGWTIAKSLLGHERLFVGSPKLCQHALHQLRELAQARGLVRDPIFMDALARITLDVLDLEALYGEYASIVKQGGSPGADVAILKIWSTETYVRLSEMILEAAGQAGAVRGKRDFGGARIDVLSHFYNARPAPIYAGSNEIQRNIIAKQVLGLPS